MAGTSGFGRQKRKKINKPKRPDSYRELLPLKLRQQLRDAYEKKYKPEGSTALVAKFENEWWDRCKSDPPDPKTVRKFFYQEEQTSFEHWLIECLCQLLFGYSFKNWEDQQQQAQITAIEPEQENELETKKFTSPEPQTTFTEFGDIPSNIPYTVVSSDRFFGRSQELSDLHYLLQQHDWVAITGMAGIGKTELAIQYTQQYKSDYPGGICWLDADDNVIFQLIEFSKTYFPHFNLREGLDTTYQIQSCWQQWQKGKVLIVIDNVTDYNKQVKPYLPPQLSRFKVLMITEEKLSIVRLDLEALKPQDALDLLRGLATSERIERELVFAEKLCECAWVDYLPLALELVGRYLAEDEDLLIVEMLQQLEEKEFRHKALTKTDSTMRIQLGVEATFELSWQRLDKNTQQLGYLLSLFNSAPIIWKFVESIEIGKCDEELTEAKRALMRFSLLRRVDKKTYRLHQLVREFIKHKLAESADAITIKQAFNDVMLRELLNVAQKILYEPDFVISRPIKNDFILQRYLIETIPNLENKLIGDERIHLFKSQFVHVLHIHCKSVTRVVQAILIQRQIVEIPPNVLDENSPPLFLLNDDTLIRVLKFSGNWFQKINPIDAVMISKALEIAPIPVGAECILNATLQLLKKQFGESHPDTIEVHKTLTLLYAYYGKWNWLK